MPVSLAVNRGAECKIRSRNPQKSVQ